VTSAVRLEEAIPIAEKTHTQVTRTKTSKHAYNPYLAARREWDERYGSLITRERNWRVMAILGSLIALASVGGMIRYLLIPQGSRLVGGYNSRIGYGQDGVQVIWYRVIFPDGSSLDLSGMIGQDAHGFSGLRDKVDRHYTRLIGFAVLTSLFAAASEISQNQNRSLLTYPSPAQVAGSTVGQQASDLGAQITRRNLNVQPTIRVAIGYRFNVRVNRDILFDAPYTPVFAIR
jgi:hypothetical protein